MLEDNIRRFVIAQLEQLARAGVIYPINTVISLTRVQLEAATCTQINGAGMKHHRNAADSCNVVTGRSGCKKYLCMCSGALSFDNNTLLEPTELYR